MIVARVPNGALPSGISCLSLDMAIDRHPEPAAIAMSSRQLRFLMKAALAMGSFRLARQDGLQFEFYCGLPIFETQDGDGVIRILDETCAAYATRMLQSRQKLLDGLLTESHVALFDDREGVRVVRLEGLVAETATL